MKSRAMLLAGTLFMTLAAGPLFGQEGRLASEPLFFMEEIQVTATRTARSSFEVAAPVEVIERRAIERVQASKPGDLFPYQAGVEVDGDGPFLGLPVIRGLAGNRILLLVDGQRLNNSREAVNFGGVQPSLVDMSQIEDIEITRGPASVLYGTDAIGGIVNLITRRPPVPAEGLVVGGSFLPHYGTTGDQRSGSARLYATSPRLSLLVDGAYRQADDYSSPRGDIANSGAGTRNLAATLEWRPAAGHVLRLDGVRFRGEDIGIPGATGIFTGTYPRTDRDKLALAYEGGLGSTAIQASAYVQDQEEDFDTVLDLPPIAAGPFDLLIDTETRRLSDVRTVGFDLQLDQPVGASQLLTYGLDVFRDDVHEDRREATTITRVPRSPGPPGGTETEVDAAATTPDGSFQEVGFFLQDEIRLDRATFLPGVRYDRFDIETEPFERPEGGIPPEDRTEDAVSASLGALYRLTERLHATASVGRAFRTPNLIERYFFGPGSQGGLAVPNPDLENETSLNVDVGMKVGTPALRGGVTVFRNRIDDFITFVAGEFEGDSTFGGRPVSTVDNVGEVRIRGVEADIEARIDASTGIWSAFGAFTWNDGENLSDDRPIFVPPVKLVLGGAWSDRDGILSSGAALRLVGRQDDLPAGFDPKGGFGVVDVHGALDLETLVGAPVTVRARIENVTDKAYEEPYGAALAPGRSLSVTLDYAFRARIDR